MLREKVERARSAMIPRVVGKEHLVEANSLSQSTRMLLQLLDPAIGTGLYMLLGLVVSFTLDAATFLASALCITMVKVSGAVAGPEGDKPSFAAQFRGGLRYCWSNLPIRTLIIGFLVVCSGAGAINTLTIFIVTKELGLPETVMSYFNTAQVAAMFAVSLTIGSLARKMHRTPLMIPLGILLVGAGVGVVALSPNRIWMVVGACADRSGHGQPQPGGGRHAPEPGAGRDAGPHLRGGPLAADGGHYGEETPHRTAHGPGSRIARRRGARSVRAPLFACRRTGAVRLKGGAAPPG